VHNATGMTVLRKKRGRNLMMVREHPKRGRKKQRSNEHYAKDVRW